MRTQMYHYSLWAIALLGWTAPVFAQDSLLSGGNATSGSTDVANEGFEAVVAPADAPADVTELGVSAGALFATGNSRSVALTGASKARLRRAMNQYSADLALNYAESSPAQDEPMEPTVENYQARIRYDRFLNTTWALFVAESARRDRFQGLGLRMNFDPGVAYYVFDEEKQRLWFEAGYDMQYDLRTDDAIATAAVDGQVVDKRTVRHAARLFGGYTNSINEHVSFNAGLEYLQAFAETKNWRLNFEAGLNSAFSDKFSLATTFNLRYDNNPLPNVEKLDTVTAVSLVYTIK